MTTKTRSLEILLVAPIAIFFAGMGVVALLDPTFTLSFFGAGPLGVDMRNEVRAVYGGFGVAISGLLFATLKTESLMAARIAVAVALIGMAGGRLVSLVIDAAPGSWPWVFLGVEVLMAALLIVSARRARRQQEP